ncbi:MAG: FadR/GntR family transcriptional regulator [Alphaproteobacteria bacterium]
MVDSRTGAAARPKRNTLHQRVVDTLGAQIVAGQTAVDEVLPNEQGLCALLNVSRTVLREGIKTLAAKGLVETRTKVGTRVRPRTDWNMLDPDVMSWRLLHADRQQAASELFDMRMIFEPVAARKAAERAVETDHDAIAAAHREMRERASNGEDYIEPDIAFHCAILNATGNQFLAGLGKLIAAGLRLSFRQSWARSETLNRAMLEHEAVLNFIRSGDGQRAEEGMRKLLQNARSDWRRVEASRASAAPAPDAMALDRQPG